MDKIVSIKRKAQRCVQAGQYDKAVAEYERLLETGDLDPYDYVYLGDLLVRTNSTDSAVERYREAIAAYERVSLYKNAIAVGKKILRIKPEAFDMHRMVGSLYYMEGLYTDSLFYYMQYLSAAPPDREGAAIGETGVRLLTMPLPSAEVALRVVDAMVAADRGTSASRPLLALASEFEERGETDDAEVLRKKAIELDPEVASGAGESPSPKEDYDPSAVFAPTIDPDRFNRAPESGGLRLRGSDDEDSSMVGADGISMDFGSISLPGENVIEIPEEPTVEEEVAPSPPRGLRLASTVEEDSAETAEPARPADGMESDDDSGNARSVVDAEEVDIPVDEALMALEPDEIVRQAEELTEAGDPAAMDAWLAAGRKCFEVGESRRAEDIYVNMVRQDPNHLGALKGLTEIAHINGERAKMVRYGCELGDVYLSLEKYALAKLEFERVLQFDPKNDKARSRVSRLNSIDGMDQVTATPLAPVASEMKGAMVSVRGEPARTQSIMDLSEILSEFQTAVAGQMSDDDAQSHYDLGMTYLEMEMHEQAMTEFEIAARSPGHRPRAVEMMARSHIESGNPERALEATEEIVSDTEIPADRLAGLHAFRGAAFEALKRSEEAVSAYRTALSLDAGLEAAVEGLRRLKNADAA